MMDIKILLPVLGVIVALITAVKLSNVKENFAGNLPSMKVKVDRLSGPSIGDMYTIPGYYQANISPRFSNVDYGANIRYNLPSTDNMAVPLDPMTYGNIVCNESAIKEGFCNNCKSINIIKEGFCSNCDSSVVNCGKGGAQSPGNNANISLGYGIGTEPRLMTANYTSGNYKEKQEKLKDSSDVTDMLPVSDMTMLSSVNQASQPIVYDRFMYANQRSILYGRGDPIRGDLPIVPAKNDWFRPSVQPQIDLRDGAMAVMGGLNNDTSKQLAQLQLAASGGTNTTGGGIKYAVQKGTFLDKGRSDISVTAFP